ncbi:MAG: putative inorganic carbon transporter subunit DabA, partial [Nitrospirota bacterium]
LRQQALNGQADLDSSLVDAAKPADLSPEVLRPLVDILRRQYDLTARAASRQKERITRTGFTLEEQTLTVDTALRMMGLTNNLARLVLICAHGSTSENNPYESALDCGACGGNEGNPNARVLAMMANNQKVRERLAKNKLAIPPDTHFLAGQMDTTTDNVQLFDLEDVPPTHRADLARLQEDLKEASTLTSQERCARFPEVEQPLDEGAAESHVRKRSVDWSQVRPEWGLSSNTAFVIGRRELTKGLNLEGRVFLQSYDARQDSNGRLLEVLLTGPQVVAQWINMEHYFSAVDNDVYGSGSKIYHNVVGRIGIMSGPWSDLRLGLARQTVMNGDVPYHEPMRLLTIVEAPRGRIDKLVERHEILRHYYHNEWVHLVALDPDDQVWYRYRPTGEWVRIDGTL